MGKPADDLPFAEEVGSEIPWFVAPFTSHVSRYRYIDAREYGLPVGNVPAGSESGSQLHVFFKDEKSGGESREYWYFFADHDTGAWVLGLLNASPHPYGDVIYPLLVRGRVPYAPQ